MAEDIEADDLDLEFDPREQRDSLQQRLEEQGELGRTAMENYIHNMVLTLGAQAVQLSPLSPSDVADEFELCARFIRNEIDDEDEGDTDEEA